MVGVPHPEALRPLGQVCCVVAVVVVVHAADVVVVGTVGAGFVVAAVVAVVVVADRKREAAVHLLGPVRVDLLLLRRLLERAVVGIETAVVAVDDVVVAVVVVADDGTENFVAYLGVGVATSTGRGVDAVDAVVVVAVAYSS